MRYNILLVEDDADDRYIMQLAFTEHAYLEQVRIIDSCEDAYQYLHNLPDPSQFPWLLVLDYNMPGMNGGELLMRLKMDEKLSHIPVAMYSTGMRQLETKLRTMGANYCFEKGNQIKEVYGLVKKLINIVEEKQAIPV